MRDAWQEAFLRVLRRSGCVSLAAELAGRDRTTVYYHRRRSAGFRREWATALRIHSLGNTKRALGR